MNALPMKKFLPVILLLALGLFSSGIVHAVTITPISPSIPNQQNDTQCAIATNTSCNPGSYINDFYSFALLIGGLLAFGAIVYGGIKYIAGAGNPSAQSEGKEWIESALLGLLLLAGAYLILKTINPALTNLTLTPLTPIPASQTGGTTPTQ